MIAALSGKRILVIEDEYFIASDLKRALIAAGAEVAGPTANVPAGLKMVADGLDAAVLDVNLEGADSYPIAEALAERDVPYLFVTGYDGWALPERYREAPRMAKPFQLGTVLERVAALIEPQS